MRRICSYTVVACWPNRKPVLIGGVAFTVERATTWHETEERARVAAQEMTANFIREHLPEGVPPPAIEKVELGAVMFVPEDRDE
jgi:hypothetical protein